MSSPATPASAATPIKSNSTAIWNLETPLTAAASTESCFSKGNFGVGKIPSKPETSLRGDARQRVSAADIQDNGKYRSIVKLFARYERQPNDGNWGMATGWLIAPDIVVTAAHVAYDFGSTRYGAATAIRAYMGYSGAANANSADVQMQYGKTFITTAGWLQSAGQAERADVAFLKLGEPFTGNLKLFTFDETPLMGVSESLGVVGYPADKKDDYGESGAEMYQMFAPTTWHLDGNVEKLLQYGISTYSGQSGSPVIRQSDGVSIGVHVLGGHNLNSASSIKGKYGNSFDAYVAAFGQKLSPVGKIEGIDIIEPASAGPDLLELDSNGRPTESTMGTEGFIDVMTTIGGVVLPIATIGLKVATPFLGPLGGPASAIAGIALNALSRATESSFDAGTKAVLLTGTTPVDLDGCAERAVLAESALQTALKIDSTTPLGQQVLKDMAETYFSLSSLEALHSKLFCATAGPTLRVALNNSIKPAPTESYIARKDLPNASSVESSFGDEPYAAFATALLTPTVPVPGTEAFFDRIASTIQKGLKYAAPILRSTARQGLVAALSSLPNSSTESSIQTPIPNAVMSAPLLQRALVAECALQAVQKIDVATLQTLPLYDAQGNHLATENFFDDLRKTMQTIGESILDIAPDVIKNVGPTALNLVAGALKNKSDAGESPKEGSLLQPDPTPSRDSPKPIPIGALARRSAAFRTHARGASGAISLAGLASSTPSPADSRMVSNIALSAIRMNGLSEPGEGAADDQKSFHSHSETTSVMSSKAEVPQYFETVGNAAGLRENLDRPVFIRAPWED